MNRRAFLFESLAAMSGMSILGLAGGCARRPAPLLGRTSVRGAAAPEADQFLASLIEAGLVPGINAMLVRGETIVYEFSGGCDAPGPRGTRAVTPDSVYNVGSVTKPVVGLLLFKLIEQGRLAFDDPVRRYVPEYPYPDHTLKHLATHTAGYDPAQTVPWPAGETGLAAFREAVYRKQPLKCQPGAQCAYWSTGYYVLMDAIERVSGMPIERFGREQLFEPLGMNSTTFDWHKVPEGRFIAPWDADANDVQHSVLKAPPTGDTGLKTTVGDLARLGQLFWRKGRIGQRQIFAEATVRQLLTECTGGRFAKTPIFWLRGPRDAHGCFGERQSPATVGHPGYTGCMFSYDPPSGLTFVFVSNGLKLQKDFTNDRRINDAMARVLS